MKIFLNKNTHVGTDEPADKTKTWLPQNLTEEANFLSNPATYGVLSGPRVKIAEGLDAQNIDAYGEKFRVYEVEPSTLVVKEYKNGAWVNMELNLDVPETSDELAGTWVFNSSPNISASQSWNVLFTVLNFSDINYGIATKYTSSVQLIQYSDEYGDMQTAYNSTSGWVIDSLKTIHITSKLSEVTNGAALLTWLKANATKQTTNVNIYDITVNNNTLHYKAHSDNPTQIKEGETVTLTFSTGELYNATASATNATCTYSMGTVSLTKVLTVTLSNATDNVVVTIDAEADPEPV